MDMRSRVKAIETKEYGVPMADIESLWAKDGRIDMDDLREESANTGIILGRWTELKYRESIILQKLKALHLKYVSDLKQFLKIPTKEVADANGWQEYLDVAEHTRLTGKDIDSIVESDPDVIRLGLEIGQQDQKVERIVSHIFEIGRRQKTIYNIIEAWKFREGR